MNNTSGDQYPIPAQTSSAIYPAELKIPQSNVAQQLTTNVSVNKDLVSELLVIINRIQFEVMGNPACDKCENEGERKNDGLLLNANYDLNETNNVLRRCVETAGQVLDNLNL